MGGTDTIITTCFPGDIYTFTHSNRLDIRLGIARAFQRAFFAMELQEIQGNRLQHLVDFIARGIHEQPHPGHEWRQHVGDPAGRIHADRTRAVVIKNEADGVGAQVYCREGVLRARNTADLDPDPCKCRVFFHHRFRLALSPDLMLSLNRQKDAQGATHHRIRSTWLRLA